jgi:hypothetical protein
MSAWLKFASIRSFGRLSLSVLFVVTVLTIGFALNMVNRIQQLDQDWQAYEENVANKVVMLGQIRSALGIDGIPKRLHNYATTGSVSDIIEAHRNLLQLKVLLRGFRSIAIDDAEIQALDNISSGLIRYRIWMDQSEQIWQYDKRKNHQIFQVDDRDMLDALRFLGER